MTAPAVQVVRPKTTVARFIGGVSAHFVRGWLVMLILGALLPDWGIGYWQSVLAVLGLRMIFVDDATTWTVSWTEAFPKRRK